MIEMPVWKTALFFEGESIADGMSVLDTIEHEGRKWLVPFWLTDESSGLSKPERIICLDLLPHQKSGAIHYDYILTQPMPRAALDGHVPPPSKGIFLIVESPTIEIDNQEISRRQN